MPDLVPVLIGTAGVVDGECFVLNRGVDVIIGRSRSCDISLRRTGGYLKSPAATRDNDHDFNTVSRRHLRVNVVDGTATMQDLSTNGTFCNGEPVKQNRAIDLRPTACTLRLGTRESFDFLLLPADDERVRHLHPVSGTADGAGDDDRG